jgi:putative NADH-flavin reductase
MKIALIGTTGFVGKHVLTELVNRGHQVTAICRNPAQLDIVSSLITPIQGDVTDAATVAKIVEGHDAVISAFNAGWSNPNLYNDFMAGSQAIEKGIKATAVKRLLVVGGAGSLEVAPGVELIDTPAFPEAYKAGASAARDYLQLLKQDTQLDWTFLSPAIEMGPHNSGKRTGHYRTGLNNPVFDEQQRSRISVEDLAVAIVDEIEHPQFIQQRFTVAY